MALQDKAITNKNNRLDSVPQVLSDGVEKSQESILSDFLKVLGGLNTDGGNISIDENNINLIPNLIDQLRGFVLNPEEYVSHIAEYSKEFDEQVDLNEEYITKEASNSVDDLSALDTKRAKDVALSKKVEAVSLLVKVDPVLLDPMRNTLVDAINSGSTYKSLVDQVQKLIVGDNDVDGRLLSNSKRIASDLFAQSDRSYTNIAAKDLGMEWYYYSGGILDAPKSKTGKSLSGGTRSFCFARNGKYYHRNEIMKWVSSSGSPSPSGEWQGKITGTNEDNIFLFAGGYNCKHTMMPVGITIVPKDVIQRNIQNGNYKPTIAEAEFLNL